MIIQRAATLAYTETAAIRSQARQDTFKELGVEKYQIVATLDKRTSNICKSLDNKVFDLKDFQVGVTAPPFHPNCRTSYTAYYEDLDNEEERRSARDKDNNRIEVPSNMSYEEWEQKYILKDKNIIGSAKLNSEAYNALKNEFKSLNSPEVILRTERLMHIKERHPEVVEVIEKNYKQVIENPDYILKDSKYDDTIWNIKRIEDKGLIMVIKLIIDKSGGYKNSIITCFRINDKITNKHIKNKKVIYIKNK